MSQSLNYKKKFTEQKFERFPLSEIEKEVVKALDNVTFLPASYDKRFWRSLHPDELYTWKQKRYIRFIFNKYRRQIKNYADLAFRLEPERFEVELKVNEADLFTIGAQTDIIFKDTFKPRKLVS